MRCLRPILDLIRYWRALDLVLWPFWSLALVITQVLIVAWLGWWSIVVLVPLNFLILYVFRFDELFHRQT